MQWYWILIIAVVALLIIILIMTLMKGAKMADDLNDEMMTELEQKNEEEIKCTIDHINM